MWLLLKEWKGKKGRVLFILSLLWINVYCHFSRLTFKISNSNASRLYAGPVLLSYYSRENFWRSQNLVSISDVYVIFSYNRIQFLLKVPTTCRAGYQYKKKHKILNLNLTVLIIFFVAPQGFGPEAITRGARLYTYMDKEYLFKKCL